MTLRRRTNLISLETGSPEDRERFAERARAVTSECNRALARASDEPTLLQNLCRIAVEAGGYRMAWAGLVRHDESRTVEPVANAGDDNGAFLRSIRLSWGDNEFGRGPAGRAVRTREPQRVQDIVGANPETFRWREEALAHGYRAVATFPLVADDETFGVFAIYAGEPRAFEVEEMALLEQLAGDIAFGVAGLRHREAQRRTEEELRRSEERFRSLTRLSSDLYWEQDDQYRFTSFSDTAPAWIASRARLAIGTKRWEESYVNMSAEDWAAHIAILAARLPFRDLELCRRLETGEKLWVSVSGEPLFDESGAFRGYHGVGKDITERKRAEELLALEHRVSLCLAGEDSALAALTAAIQAVCEAEGWDCGRYLRVDERAGVLRLRASWNRPGPELEHYMEDSRGMVYGPGVGLVGHVWQTGAPLWVPDITRDKRVARRPLALVAGMRGAFVVPIAAAERTIGVVIFQAREIREPDDRLLKAVYVIGSQIGQFLLRKRSDEERRRFRAAMDATADLILLIDRESMRFVDVNETACRQLGYSRDELMSMGPQDVLPTGREELERAYDRLAAEPSPTDGMRSHFRRKDGSTIPFESTRHIFPSGSSRVVAMISRDISERIAAETALRESKERFDMAVRATHDVIWDRNLLTDEVWWNENYSEVYGSGGDDEGRALRWSDGIHPEDRERVLAGIESVIREGGEDWSDKYRIRCTDGSYREVFDRGHLIRDGSGRAVRMIGALADASVRAAAEATARNRALQQLVSERTAELEAAIKELEAFSYSVSHDLRAPLRHIDGFAKLVLERSQAVDETTARYLDTIRRAARRMGQLIDDLLALSKTSRAELRTQGIDLDQLVHEVRAECERDAPGRVLAWKIGKLPRVIGDRSLLRIAFVNLLSNAVKFTSKRDEALIEIAAQPGKRGEVVVSVKDNGAGFDPRYADKLFGVFQRLHRESEFEGTGIGLATVRRIVTRHGGRVWAEGRPEIGASFFVALNAEAGRRHEG